MKIKAPLIAGIVMILCLSVLFIPAILSDREKNQILVHAVDIGSPKINVYSIEEFAENEFLLTYEIHASDRASVTHASYPVTVIGTNSCYAQIIGYPMREGSFFSRQAWMGKQRHAVLNEKAAFTIFGSNHIAGSRFQMRNEAWLITGVISDGDNDTPKIYIPSSVRGGEAGSLMALSSTAHNEAYIINSLKTLGIREGSFGFFNLETHNRLLWQRPLVILYLIASLFLLSMLMPLAGKCRRKLITLKTELSRHYPGELLRTNGRIVYIPFLFCLGFAIIPVAALLIILELVTICLPWQDLPSFTDINKDLFFPYLVTMRNIEQVSLVLFVLSLASLLVFFMVFNLYLVSAKKSEKVHRQ